MEGFGPDPFFIDIFLQGPQRREKEQAAVCLQEAY